MSLASEEGYDRMRDDRLVKYGIGHDGLVTASQPLVDLVVRRLKVKLFTKSKQRKSMVKV